MKHKYTNFTQQEMMAVAAAREIKDGEIIPAETVCAECGKGDP